MESTRLKSQKLPKFAQAVAAELDMQPKPILTHAALFEIMWLCFENGGSQFLRSPYFNKSSYRRARTQLRRAGYIRQDSDYSACWRVMTKGDVPAEDIICSIDPHCYVSHMSAMQRYGLTNRRPKDLHMTRPTDIMRRAWLKEHMHEFYGPYFSEHGEEIERARAVIHRSRVRGRAVHFTVTKHYADHLDIKGSLSRIATVGQTFLDMLDEPDACGGMAHVLDVWAEHARTYLDEIISHVDRAERPILKVRAGYILDEGMGIENERIEGWTRFAQRGSSRVLVAGKPFVSDHSEKWMLSINA